MKTNLLEVIMGALVLVACAIFAAFVYFTSYWSPSEGYEVIAKFERVDGLRQGSDVRLGGVKIGTIQSIELDPKTYLAVVHMSLNQEILLPQDTAAAIVSEGLLSGKFLALLPGGEEEFIKPGGEIAHTQSSVSLESLIGQFIFNAQEKK